MRSTTGSTGVGAVSTSGTTGQTVLDMASGTGTAISTQTDSGSRRGEISSAGATSYAETMEFGCRFQARACGRWQLSTTYETVVLSARNRSGRYAFCIRAAPDLLGLAAMDRASRGRRPCAVSARFGGGT